MLVFLWLVPTVFLDLVTLHSISRGSFLTTGHLNTQESVSDYPVQNLSPVPVEF